MTNQKEKRKVPELRFPEFSGEWEEKKLKDITEKISDGLHSTPIYDEYGEISFINGNNLKNGKVVLKDSKKVSLSEFNKYRNNLKKNRSILLSINGTIGNIAYYRGEKILLGKSAAYINHNEDMINRMFLFFTLQTQRIQKYFWSELTGTTIKNLSLNSISNTKIISPKYEEQQKIGKFFSKLDRQIELEEKKLALLEEQKKGYMQKIFSQELRFKDENGMEYPEWEEVKLKDLFQMEKGYGLSKEMLEKTGLNSCILYGELFTTYKEVINEIHSSTNSFDGKFIEEKCILFPNSTTTKAVDLVTFSSLNKTKTYIGGDVTILFSKNLKEVNYDYMAYYLTNYEKVKKEISKYAQGITIVHLNFNNFKNIKVKISFINEQIKIAKYLNKIDYNLELLRNRINLLNKRKKSLLSKMYV